MYLVKHRNSHSVFACRGCLATDVKLFNMFDCENKLFEHFGRFLGVPILAGDGYPHHLCSTCAVYLQKFIAFRNICVKAQNMLEEAEVRGIQITTSYIRKMDRDKHMHFSFVKKQLFNISLTNSNVIDEEFIDTFDNHEAIDFNADNMNCTVIKEENINYDYNNDATEFVTADNKIIDSNFSNVNDTNNKDHSVNSPISNDILVNNDVANGMTTIYLKTEDDNDLKDEKQQIESKKKRTVKRKKQFIDNYLNEAKPTQIGKKKKVLKRTTPDKTKEEKRRGKCKKRNVIDITKEFAEQNNFDLTIYTREEQLEEVKVLKETPTDKIQCEHCGLNFKYKHTFLNHFRSKHDPSLGDYVCTICNVRFRQLRYLYKHKLHVHLFKYECRVCKFSTKARGTAEAHAAFHAGKTFACECGRIFKHNSSYLSHKRLTHTSKLTICEFCGESFIGDWGLVVHKQKIHSDVIEACMFVCGKCDAKFKTDDALVKHEGLNCGGYNCVHCGDVFTTEKVLRYHLVQYHNNRSNSEEFECEVCRIKFHNKTARERHSIGRCLDVVPCVQCGEGFPTEQQMNEHLNVHSTEEFKCEVCKKIFKSAFYFADHYARHGREQGKNSGRGRRRGFQILPSVRKGQSIDKKRVMCEVCGQLCLETGYSVHLKIHSDEKDYACSMCSKRFRALLPLEIHMRVHTNERPYECDHCQKKFKSRGALCRHIKTVHLALRPHQCHLCQKFYKTSTCVKMHIKTVHMKFPMPPRIRKPRQLTEKSAGNEN
ncbi:zinc finger protein 611-like [Achroia grisella]|uniref:zinc finger protein 611-like n=1 Tax=Achroia grisella TaxID=688607 RepID=UPI0027D2167D|nr:zinc finger protein 611-like [Achroia grisella]